MNLLEEFCSQAGLIIPYSLEYEDIEHKSDDSEFEVVDGEEGDNGIIKYYTPSGTLIAIYTNYGGDSTEIEFTKAGKELLSAHAKSIFEKCIETISIVNDEE